LEPTHPGEEQAASSPNRGNVSPSPQEKVDKVASISKKTEVKNLRASPPKVKTAKADMVGAESPIWALRKVNPFETQGAVLVLLLYCAYLAVGTLI